jgi:hypothetical protein
MSQVRVHFFTAIDQPRLTDDSIAHDQRTRSLPVLRPRLRDHLYPVWIVIALALPLPLHLD